MRKIFALVLCIVGCAIEDVDHYQGTDVAMESSSESSSPCGSEGCSSSDGSAAPAPDLDIDQSSDPQAFNAVCSASATWFNWQCPSGIAGCATQCTSYYPEADSWSASNCNKVTQTGTLRCSSCTSDRGVVNQMPGAGCNSLGGIWRPSGCDRYTAGNPGSWSAIEYCTDGPVCCGGASPPCDNC